MLAARRYRHQFHRCRRIHDRLDIPDPFDAFELLARLAERRGRPIELLATPWRPGFPCGMVVATDTADYIVYSSDLSPLHRQHILVHEAAHLLCGHVGGYAPGHTGGPGAVAAGGPAPDGGPAAVPGEYGPGPDVARLTPHLSPALVRRVLGRTAYAEPHEQEAEMLASMILHRAVWSGRWNGGRA